jgi:3-oxoacyl-[acyl-carrier protein] reductase
MDLGLKDKTALVFGAGGGLGGAIARTLAGEGANIVVADVNREAAQATVDAITSGGGKALML